jgi:hypothetical protein
MGIGIENLASRRTREKPCAAPKTLAQLYAFHCGNTDPKSGVFPGAKLKPQVWQALLFQPVFLLYQLARTNGMTTIQKLTKASSARDLSWSFKGFEGDSTES